MVVEGPDKGKLDVDKVFIEQARSLVSGGELLPDSIEDLAKKLQYSAETRTPLKVKLGLDPTRPDLHLGHSVVLRKLRAFQDLGHQAILIIGDSTSMIGDPSGRNVTRPPLSREEVETNAQTYLDQAGKIIDIQKAQLVRNSQWFDELDLGDLLKMASKVTIAQLLVREDFAKRYGENKPIFMHELYYPLMQGYDSVMVESDIELGGTDQRFNNLMGRELQSAYQCNSSQMVLLIPLLEGTDGKVKMSKSYPEHCINLTDPPEEMYGKLMSIPDDMITRYELLLTSLGEEIVKDHARMMTLPPAEGGINPRDLKAGLAKLIVSLFYPVHEAEAAEQAFIKQFRNKEIPDDIPEISLKGGENHSLLNLITDRGLAPSKSEARRLIQGGGVRVGGDKINHIDYQLSGSAGSELVIQVGKRKFLKALFQ